MRYQGEYLKITSMSPCTDVLFSIACNYKIHVSKTTRVYHFAWMMNNFIANLKSQSER